MRIFSTLALCAALGGVYAAAPAQAATKVNVATVPVADFAPAFVAKDKGFFEKNGIDAEIVSIPLAPMVPAGIVSGSVQIGMTTPPIFLQAVANGLDLQVVSALSWETKEHPQMALIARKGSGLKEGKSFEGKKVAVPGLQSLADLTTREWLKKHGADLSKINFVEVAFPQLVDVLKSGTVDAIASIEPVGAAAIASGAGEFVANQLIDQKDGAVITFWIASGDWAKANPQAVKGFRDAMDQATAWIADNPDEAKKVAAKYIKREPAGFPTWKSKMVPADLAFHEDVARDLGFLSAKVDVSGKILPW